MIPSRRVFLIDIGYREHVLQDLEPFVCLKEQCTTPNAHYRTLEDWLYHIGAEHNSSWSCAAPKHDSSLDFNTQDKFIQHVKMEHTASFTDSQLSHLSRMNQSLRISDFNHCHLCGATRVENSEPGAHDFHQKMISHVVGHLQAVAVAACMTLKTQLDAEFAPSPQPTIQTEKV